MLSGIAQAYAFSLSQGEAGVANHRHLIRPEAVWLIGLKIINLTSQEGDSHHKPAQQQGE